MRETATCRDALRDYQLQLDERGKAERCLKRQLAEAMDELREAREALQFAEDELRSMSVSDPVTNGNSSHSSQQSNQEENSRDKSPEQNSERTPPDGNIINLS